MGLKNYKLRFTEKFYSQKMGIKKASIEKRTIYKVRGIPKGEAAKFFEMGFVEYRKPFRMREALRRNSSKKKTAEIIPNYWALIRKENKKVYNKRRVLKNGTTRPIEIK